MLVPAGLLTVGLSGTGLLLQAYFVGVLQVLSQQGIIRPGITKVAGTSGGAVAAVVFNSGRWLEPGTTAGHGMTILCAALGAHYSTGFAGLQLSVRCKLPPCCRR